MTILESSVEDNDDADYVEKAKIDDESDSDSDDDDYDDEEGGGSHVHEEEEDEIVYDDIVMNLPADSTLATKRVLKTTEGVS